MSYIFIAVLSLLFACGYAVAEEVKEEKKVFDPLVVTATRTERSTEEIPAGVTVVTSEEIKDTRMFNIKEALTGITGVQAESKNGGYDARLIIRGAGLKARYGVREIMILLDGVPITDPDGMSRLDFVDTQLVDRIDVVKGPNSTLYGANAAGGVINIITRSPFDPQNSAKVGYGDYNSQMYNVNLGSGIGDTFFSVSGSRRSTKSWRQWNEFSTDQGNLKIGHMFDEKTTVEATVSYTKANLQLPGSLTKEQFDTDITQLTAEPWRNSGRYSEVFYTNLKLEKEMGDLKLRPVLYFEDWSHFHPVTGLINDGGASVYGADLQGDLTHRLIGLDGVLTVGVAAQVDAADGEKYTYRDLLTTPTGRIISTLSDKKGALAETGDDTTSKWGVFAQESLRPSDRWIVDLGVRYDQVNFDIKDEQFISYNYGMGNYVTDRQTFDLNKDFQYVSPRLGLVYKLTKEVNLYGNISSGFQTPQSSEISTNPNLDPMTVWNYETGMKARFEGGHSVDLSLFYMTLNDEIVQVIEPGNISTYSNAGRTTKKGIELSAKAQVMEGLFIGGGYTYSDFRFDEFFEPVRMGMITVPVDRGGNRLPYVPEHQYSLFAFYKHPSGFRAKVDTNTWGRYYVDNANSETYKGYRFLSNLLIGYERKNLGITVDVYNLFDSHYAMEVTKDSSGKTSYKPGAPRTWMARLNYTF